MPATWILLAAALAGPPARDTATHSVTIETGVQVTTIDKVQVPAGVAGVLSSLTIHEGQTVKEGEEVGHVDDKAAKIAGQKAAIELRIARAQSESEVNLKFARKAHGVAKAELARSLESIKTYPKSVSATDIDQQRLAADKAELEIEQAQRDLEIAKMTAELKQAELAASQHDVDLRKIISPISGVVVQMHKKQGEWVNPGDPVVRILTLDRLRVECSLSAAIYGPELNGCPVKLNMEMKNRKESFEGKIVFVSPEVEPVNGKFRVWAEVENRDGLLRPGQPNCTLTIALPGPAGEKDKGTDKAAEKPEKGTPEKTAKSE